MKLSKFSALQQNINTPSSPAAICWLYFFPCQCCQSSLKLGNHFSLGLDPGACFFCRCHPSVWIPLKPLVSSCNTKNKTMSDVSSSRESECIANHQRVPKCPGSSHEPSVHRSHGLTVESIKNHHISWSKREMVWTVEVLWWSTSVEIQKHTIFPKVF